MSVQKKKQKIPTMIAGGILCIWLWIGVKDSPEDETTEAGLYPSGGSFIPWDNLGIDVETDYISTNYKTEARSPYKVFSENSYEGELVLPDNIKSIGDYAFCECDSLESIDLSNTQITSIGEQAFGGCTSLTNIDLSKTQITSIGDNAFGGCVSLTSIDLSNTQITKIGVAAFQNCTSLTNINYAGTKEEWQTKVIENSDSDWNYNSSIQTITCSDGKL